MNKSFYALLVAQFLSAFADNAVLFTVIAIVMQSNQQAAWYVPALQSAFLIAFVVLAPWVGNLADQYPKSRILALGNLIKAGGALLLLFNIEPLIAYAVVGVGAAVYSPAKYGILPELTNHAALVKANAWIEASTILAILLGMVVGAKVADYSIHWALYGTLGLFLMSAATTSLLPRVLIRPESMHQTGIKVFITQIKDFLARPSASFAILGASLFWASAATLRVILVAWAPAILHSHNASDIAQLTLFLAIGIIIGSALVPMLIPLEHLRRARFAAYVMGILIIILSAVNEKVPAQVVLFFVGLAGGIFIVPINAAIQELGKNAIGSGAAVAVQGFFQNAAMLLGVGLYTLGASFALQPALALIYLGICVLLCAVMVSLKLKAKVV